MKAKQELNRKEISGEVGRELKRLTKVDAGTRQKKS